MARNELHWYRLLLTVRKGECGSRKRVVVILFQARNNGEAREKIVDHLLTFWVARYVGTAQLFREVPGKRRSRWLLWSDNRVTLPETGRGVVLYRSFLISCLSHNIPFASGESEGTSGKPLYTEWARYKTPYKMATNRA